MTTRNNKTALSHSANDFMFYPLTSHQNHYFIQEPEGEYSAQASSIPDSTTLCDRLENHLARYHFHHLSLMALACGEEDSNSWEFGAYLTGRALQQESELLISELS